MSVGADGYMNRPHFQKYPCNCFVVQHASTRPDSLNLSEVTSTTGREYRPRGDYLGMVRRRIILIDLARDLHVINHLFDRGLLLHPATVQPPRNTVFTLLCSSSARLFLLQLSHGSPARSYMQVNRFRVWCIQCPRKQS